MATKRQLYIKTQWNGSEAVFPVFLRPRDGRRVLALVPDITYWRVHSFGRWSYTTKTNPNIIHGGIREDGYAFVAYRVGRKVVIRAGCRCFTFHQAEKHWRHKPQYWVGNLSSTGIFTATDYNRRKKYNAWSLKTLAAMRKEAKKRGWIK